MSEIDLRCFCSIDDSETVLQNPFSFGKFTYATDRKIIVRVDKRTEFILGVNSELGKAAQALFEKYPVGELETLPELPPKTPCEMCDGIGQHECECGSCHVCGSCQGTKLASKEFRAHKSGDPVITLGNKRHNLFYLRMIQHLPGLQISPNAAGQYDIMPFIFTGGCGLLTTLRCYA